MEIENESHKSEELSKTIIINSDNYPTLQDINLKSDRNLCLFVDTKNDIKQYNQHYFVNVMKAIFKAEVIEMNVGMRFAEQEQKDREGLGDWIYYLKGIGKSIKNLRISIGDYILNRSNLEQFGQELLRLNHLEQLYLQIGKEKNFGVTGFTQLGESLRRMTQLKELSIVISDNCSLGANGAKKLFCGLEACEKIKKLKLHIGCYNRLNAEGTQIISTAVGQLKQVIDFELFIAKTNDIGNEGMQSITKNILQQHLSKSGERLSLKIDDMKGIKAENIVQIFSSIEEFSRLKYLSVGLGANKEMKEDSIKSIQGSLQKLKSLLKIYMNISTDPCGFSATPMVDLLTQFQFSNKLVSLQLAIPPQNEFNNAALSLFAVNLKRLSELQVFSLEIQKNNIQGNTVLRRKEPANRGDDKDKKVLNKKTTKKQEGMTHKKGISDISESLSSLKKLEKVEWIISTQNDVSDGGWEMLSKSRSLREFRVKIGERCKLQDEGLHSLSKICSSISLDCLRVEVDNGNETSEGGWSNIVSSVSLEKMKDFNITVGLFNECSEKSLGQLAASFEKSSPHIEYLTLDFKESKNNNSESIQQLTDSLKSMVNLKQLSLILPQELFIDSFAVNSLSNSIKRMRDLRDLMISFRVQECVTLSDEIKLCSSICSLKNLHHFNLNVQGNGQLEGNSIMKRSSSSVLSFYNQYLLKFKTENGLQFKKQLKKELISQETIDKLAQNLDLLVQVSQQVVYLQIQIDGMNVGQNLPQFTQLANVLSGFTKCVKLKLNFKNHFLDEISLNKLADSITCMPLLSKIFLDLDAQFLPLKTAETLAGFLQNSPRITKIQLSCRFHTNQAQSQAQFLIMSSILSCLNVKRFQVSFESFSLIKLKSENQQIIQNLPLVSLMQETTGDGNLIVEETNENVSIQKSTFEFTMKDSQEPDNDETMIYLGKFLLSTKNLQKIVLSVSSQMQISTKEAGIIQEGIKNQANLKIFQLDFFGKCFVSGEGAVLISQSFVNQKSNKKQQIMKMQADNTFSIDNALSALVSALNDQTLDIESNTLKIAGKNLILTANMYPLKNNYILKTRRPKQITLWQGNNPDQSNTMTISQIADKLLLGGISDLEFNASYCIQEGDQDWSSFRQLSSLTRVSIQDQSLNTSSRFLSLESALSHMTNLQSLTLTLSHTHENISSQNTIIPFGKGLQNLKKITSLTISLFDFNFVEDGGQALVFGIEGMTELEQLQIDCRNPQQLQIEAIKYLCEIISKSTKISQFSLYFFGIHSSLEIPYFNLLKNLLQNKQLSSNKSSISVNGQVHQAFSQTRRFSILNSPIDLNRGLYFHEIQLPSNYCQKSIFENEAINKCTDILQLYYASSEETYSIENVTVVFEFLNPQHIQPNLIFLKTLFQVLQQQKRRVKTLKVDITVSQNDQFQLIFDNALKDIQLVDTLQLKLNSPYYFQFKFQELYSITSLNNLTILRIYVYGLSYQNSKILRQYFLRKMKRLCKFNYDNYYS